MLTLRLDEPKRENHVETLWKACDFIPIVATIVSVANLIFKMLERHKQISCSHPVILHAAKQDMRALMLKLIPLVGQAYALINTHIQTRSTPCLPPLEGDSAFYNNLHD